MSRDRELSRRSFVSLVTGGAVAGSVGLVSGASAAGFEQGCSDSDPSSTGDPIGRGRRCANQPQTGCSDTDTGTNGDPGGRGRRCAQNRYAGCSDRDSGPNSDPGGRGRFCSPSDTCSDSDTGNGSDPAGRGRRCTAPGGTGAGGGGGQFGATSTVPCTECSCPDYVPTSGNQFARCARSTCGHSAGSHAGPSGCRPNTC